MKNDDKKKKLDDYKRVLEELKKIKSENDNKKLSSQFNKSLNTKKLVKQPNGFTSYLLPILITTFIIGLAIGLAIAIYYF